MSTAYSLKVVRLLLLIGVEVHPATEDRLKAVGILQLGYGYPEMTLLSDLDPEASGCGPELVLRLELLEIEQLTPAVSHVGGWGKVEAQGLPLSHKKFALTNLITINHTHTYRRFLIWVGSLAGRKAKTRRTMLKKDQGIRARVDKRF